MLEYFRHSIIRNVTAGFGTLFNDIHIARFDSNNTEVKRIKVPLSYGPKQKFIVRLDQADSELLHKTEMILPRISYELTNIIYDGERKLQTTRRIGDVYNSTSLETRFERVPYNLIYNLNIMTKNTEDAFQILEQILPYFGPDFCITFNNFPLDEAADVPISIGEISFSEEYEGDFQERKVFLITISFVAKANIYGPVSTKKVILQSEVNLVDFDGQYIVSGTTSSDRGDIETYTITGATFATVIASVTGGATAGSIGNTGTIDLIIREY